ncbi:MAG: hypothetical protein ABL936_00480 [Aestuariivirga sp.]
MAANLDRAQLEAARQIFAHPLVAEILDDLETNMLNSAVTSKPTEPLIVAAYLAEVRAIRSFRDRLSFIVQDGDETLRREAAAQSGAAKK